MMPVQRLICFCRYFLWFTFRLDLTGLSRASLMLLEAESMKLSKSRVASGSSPPKSAPPVPSSAPPGAAAGKQKGMKWWGLRIFSACLPCGAPAAAAGGPAASAPAVAAGVRDALGLPGNFRVSPEGLERL
uniref:Uncharacterized protein n=1 Tax=Sphenodon punctatus TaxID=8508 RepID=A0A8D0L4I5_SPHPU